MNANHSFSRRFFGDFIASRIKAWRLERVNAEPSAGSPAHHPAGKAPRPDTESRPDAAARENRHTLLPGLAEPRRSHGLELG
jgi:hypothetical protein